MQERCDGHGRVQGQGAAQHLNLLTTLTPLAHLAHFLLLLGLRLLLDLLLGFLKQDKQGRQAGTLLCVS